jgi:hypothetical protein
MPSGNLRVMSGRHRDHRPNFPSTRRCTLRMCAEQTSGASTRPAPDAHRADRADRGRTQRDKLETVDSRVQLSVKIRRLYRGHVLQCSAKCMGCKGSRVQISALRPVFQAISLQPCGHLCGHFYSPSILTPVINVSCSGSVAGRRYALVLSLSHECSPKPSSRTAGPVSVISNSCAR